MIMPSMGSVIAAGHELSLIFNLEVLPSTS